MSKSIDALYSLIQNISSLSDSDKSSMQEHLSGIKKELEAASSNYITSEKDRELATTYLNKTILDLERNHKQLSEANTFLAHQNVIIDSNLQKLISAYEELEQFTYIASHDLKSPLRTIASYAQLLQVKYEDKLDAKANEYLNIIVQSMHNMTDVIDDSLAYSRIGREGVKRTKPVQIKEIIEIVKKNLDIEIQESGAKIIYEELPTIVGKKTNFIQLFQNLISNSIKYKSEKPPLININSSIKEDGSWIISVKDNGRGIKKIYHESIFQPFKRIDDDNIAGAGIGLAICKKICHMYGGKISIDSDTDRGTTFTILLKDIIQS